LVNKVTALNTVQKINTIQILDRIVIQPNTWYTCPAGKRAIVDITYTCTGLGAAANSTMLAGGETIRRYLAAGGGTNPWDRDLAPNIVGKAKFQLEAGEILQTVQDSGTNSEWEMFGTVQETPT